MNRGRGQGGLLNGVVHSAVSVAAEYRAHRKEVKAAAKPKSHQNDHNNQVHTSSTALHSSHEDWSDGSGHGFNSAEKHEDLSIDDDEAVWQLDEATAPNFEECEAEDASTGDLVNDVLHLNRPNISMAACQPLPCPVIIPQRRPRDKKRGFVRAYAPVLSDSGVDQATFLQFLKNFQKSSQASPIFPIIQVSAAIASCTPSLIALAVCMGVQVVATAGAEVQSRHRTNTFLDQMNNALFKPRGLYAMIIKYKPGSSGDGVVQAQAFDISKNEIIAKCIPSSQSSSDRMRKLRLSSGTTRGADALPQAAPLIFPDIDHAIAMDGGKETFKDRTRDAKKFLNDYMDRRAQIKYAASDPNSALNLPEDRVRMQSKLSDPNHPMYSGTIVDLLGGRFGRDRGQGDGQQGTAIGGGPGRGGFGGNGAGGGRSAISKKLLKEDVLYLMIVNLPSEAELEEAQQLVDKD